MKIRFSSRVTVSAGACCVAALLALGPATSAAAGADPAGDAGARPSLLHRSGTQVRPHRDAPDVPDVSALSWLVSDAGTGDVLAAHAAHRRLPPASTLKTLFALTVLPSLPSGLRHRVTAADLAGIGPGSSLVGVAEDQTYSVADLWRGVFLNSGNDAVHVLAAMNGGWAATTAGMQAKARSLGALDTQVRSPDGYDAPGQVSSAYDLAVFGRAGLRNADFARYCATAEAVFPGGGGWSYGIANTNRLLTGHDGVERYPGLIGVKNGYTTHAGNTLVAAARHSARTLVVTVMNPQSGGGLTVYEEARALLDWGFEAAGRVDPVGSLDAPRTRPRPGPEPAAKPVTTPAGAASAASAASPSSAESGASATAAASVRDSGPGWPEVAGIAGAAVLGAVAVALALGAVCRRSPRG